MSNKCKMSSRSNNVRYNLSKVMYFSEKFVIPTKLDN